MSLQSWCNYSVVAARVLWEGEEREEEGGGGVTGRLVGRDVTRCACKKKKKNRRGVQQEVWEELFVLNGRVKDGWWGPHNWKGEKIRQADGGFFFCFVLFFVFSQKNVLSSFNSSQHQSELEPPASQCVRDVSCCWRIRKSTLDLLSKWN